MTQKKRSSDANEPFYGDPNTKMFADSWRWEGACCPSTEGGAPESPEFAFFHEEKLMILF